MLFKKNYNEKYFKESGFCFWIINDVKLLLEKSSFGANQQKMDAD